MDELEVPVREEPEGVSPSVAIGDGLPQREQENRSASRWRSVVEFGEVFILAVVAFASAWSGFHAARWDSRQASDYSESTRLRIESGVASTNAGQELMYDAGLFTSWLEAQLAGNAALQALIEARFTPDYRPSFNAWRALVDSGAPAPSGPRQMPEYRNLYQEDADRLSDEATVAFDNGAKASENSDHYVRATVLFATVLLLIATGQRLRNHGPRLGVGVIAGLLLVYSVATVIGLPRL